MTEYSKTPWRAEGPDDFGDYNILNGDDCLAIAAVISNMRPAECVAANAAFIVRAANCHAKLVETLDEVTQALSQHEAGSRIDNARNALAKARGEAP